MNPLLLLLGAAGLALLAQRRESPQPSVTLPAPSPPQASNPFGLPPGNWIETASPVVTPGAGRNTKRVTIGERVYVVFRSDVDLFQVTLENDPNVFVTFDSNGITEEGGDAAGLAQLKKDMYAFPSNLFTQ